MHLIRQREREERRVAVSRKVTAESFREKAPHGCSLGRGNDAGSRPAIAAENAPKLGEPLRCIMEEHEA
jgi:hypothetical protein